jgi:hypothetical protein
MEISAEIKKNRPNISDNSVKTYTSILKSLFKKYADPSDTPNAEWFADETKIIKKLDGLPVNIRKTIYSALIAINPEESHKQYKKEMMSDAQTYQNEMIKQNKTPQQEKQWLTQEQIKDKYDEIKKEVKGLLNKKEPLTKGEFKNLQNYILLSFSSGIFFPPRRSLDIVNFKIKNINADTDNYLDKNNLVFNSYKGSKDKGRQTISLAKNPFLTILKKYIKLNPFEYLIVDANGNQMTSIKINQHIKKIFDGLGGINIFRHSFITEKYPIFNVEQLKKDSESMGSSSNMMLNTYIKRQ